MTISAALHPPGAQDILGSNVPHLLNARPSRGRVVGGAIPMTIKASQPLEVFTLTVADAQARTPLALARFVGWRYLIDDGGVPVVADLRRGDAQNPQFSSLTRGAFAEGLKLAGEQATRLYGASGQAFEARILEVPSIYSVSLWLHGEQDVFFPYLEPSGRVPTSISADDRYLSKIGDAARKKAAASSTPAVMSP